MTTIKQIIIDVTTIANGKNGCYAKVNGWIAFFMGSAVNIYDCITNKHAFDYKDFCIGTATIITAVGAAIMMKKNDEPTE